MKKNFLLFGISISIALFTSCISEKKLDRPALVCLMEQYLDALANHDPSVVPLANDVKLVENTEVTPIGKGLWETATGGPKQFKIFVADPAAGQVAFMGVIEETDKRANPWGPFDLPAAHVFKIRNGLIYEIEAIGYIAQHGIENGWE